MLPFLIGIGIRTLSVDPIFLPQLQATIGGLALADAEQHAKTLLAQSTIAGVREAITARQQA